MKYTMILLLADDNFVWYFDNFKKRFQYVMLLSLYLNVTLDNGIYNMKKIIKTQLENKRKNKKNKIKKKKMIKKWQNLKKKSLYVKFRI